MTQRAATEIASGVVVTPCFGMPFQAAESSVANPFDFCPILQALPSLVSDSFAFDASGIQQAVDLITARSAREPFITTRRVSEEFVGAHANSLRSIPHLRFGFSNLKTTQLQN